MPVDPIYTQLLICERVIREEDNAYTIVRIVDRFNIIPKPHIAPVDRPILLSFLFTAKFPSDDASPHRVLLKLQRPSGRTDDIGDAGPVTILDKEPGFPRT